jgi:hypothetical protein
MSDIRFNSWYHQSGTGGLHQDANGRLGIGTTQPTNNLQIIGTITADNFRTNAGTDIVSKTLTLGTRTGAQTINIVGTGMTLALRSGVGTATF